MMACVGSRRCSCYLAGDAASARQAGRASSGLAAEICGLAHFLSRDWGCPHHSTC